MPSESWRSENKVFTETTQSAAELAKAQAHVLLQLGTKPCLTKPLSHGEVVSATGSKQQRHPTASAVSLLLQMLLEEIASQREVKPPGSIFSKMESGWFPLICKDGGWVKKKRCSVCCGYGVTRPGCAYLPGDCVGQKGEGSTQVLSPVLTGCDWPGHDWGDGQAQGGLSLL